MSTKPDHSSADEDWIRQWTIPEEERAKYTSEPWRGGGHGGSGRPMSFALNSGGGGHIHPKIGRTGMVLHDRGRWAAARLLDCG